MLTKLVVPYIDTTPRDLRFALKHPVMPALTVLDIPSSAGIPALQLRLLGASHQAVLTVSQGTWVETLACLPYEPKKPLPARYTAEISGLKYQFTLEVQCFGDHAVFAQEVAAVRDWVDQARYGVAGSFPGTDDAVTALLAEPAERHTGSTSTTGQLTWTTWHTYPNTREVVRTHSTVRSAGPSLIRGRRL